MVSNLELQAKLILAALHAVADLVSTTASNLTVTTAFLTSKSKGIPFGTNPSITSLTPIHVTSSFKWSQLPIPISTGSPKPPSNISNDACNGTERYHENSFYDENCNSIVFYAGYTNFGMRTACMSQYWSWMLGTPQPHTYIRTFFEGIDTSGDTEIDTQIYETRTNVVTGQIPSIWPGHASPPCVSSSLTYYACD